MTRVTPGPGAADRVPVGPAAGTVAPAPTADDPVRLTLDYAGPTPDDADSDDDLLPPGDVGRYYREAPDTVSIVLVITLAGALALALVAWVLSLVFNLV